MQLIITILFYQLIYPIFFSGCVRNRCMMAASRLARQSICAEMAKDQQDLLKFKMALQPDKRQMEYEQTLVSVISRIMQIFAHNMLDLVILYS